MALDLRSPRLHLRPDHVGRPRLYTIPRRYQTPARHRQPAAVAVDRIRRVSFGGRRGHDGVGHQQHAGRGKVLRPVLYIASSPTSTRFCQQRGSLRQSPGS